MHTTYKAFLVAAVCFSLSACESIKTLNSSDKGETTVASSGVDMYGSDMDTTYGDITREMSNGSVEIYSFDQPAPNVMASRMDGGVVTDDPNVTVYPIGDIPTYPSGVQQAAPALMPPSHTRNMDSPFGGPLQAPLDAPMEIDSSYRPDRSPINDSFEPVVQQPTPPAPMSAPYSEAERARIYFAHGSSQINGAGKDVINHVAYNSHGPLSVEGHASTTTEVDDPVTQRIINLKMSMKRAYEVSESLIKQGVPADRITTKAYGDTQPSMPVAGYDQEAASRRVEILEAMPAQAPVAQRAPVYAPMPAAVRPVEPPMPDSAPIPPLARY